MRRPLGRLRSEPYHTLTRGMQLLLVGLFVYGLVTRAPKTITNAGFGVVVTFLPALMHRNFRLTLDPFLTLWVTAAVFFHAIGSAGAYYQVWWYDHFTHALSASVIAAVGYVLVRILMLYSDTVTIPRKFLGVYVLIFVTAMGVIWEVFEYTLDVVSAVTGIQMPLAQFGIEDTMRDLMFNMLGALFVAIWGQVYLSEFAEQLHSNRLTDD